MVKQVALFANDRRANAIRKEQLVYDSVDIALNRMSNLACTRRSIHDGAPPPSLPGLNEVRSHEAVVALGRAAHTVLADYRKCTLLAGVDQAVEEGEIERLIWSCVNTSKILALGRASWRSIQMLPIADRRFHEMPPLRMPGREHQRPSDDIGNEILVINHERNDGLARQLAETLSMEGYAVQRTGVGDDMDGDDPSYDGAWAASAAIHIHIGHHDEAADEIRLIDTWHSRRYAIAYLPRRLMRTESVGAFAMEADKNCFVCDTLDKVLAACVDIRADRVLRKKMAEAGAAAARPLADAWAMIASELVA